MKTIGVLYLSDITPPETSITHAEEWLIGECM